MLRRIIIRNGKKYIVNVPDHSNECSWLDGIAVWDTGSSPTPIIQNGVLAFQTSTDVSTATALYAPKAQIVQSAYATTAPTLYLGEIYYHSRLSTPRTIP